MNHTDPPSDDDLVLEPPSHEETPCEWDPWHDAALRVELFGMGLDRPLAAFAADTLYDMMGHGGDRTDREVGGILLGDFVETPRGAMTRVADIVIADSNEASLHPRDLHPRGLGSHPLRSGPARRLAPDRGLVPYAPWLRPLPVRT